MGLFGLKAKTVSQARAGGVFAGLDEDDDLDVPVTSSVASRCSHVSSSAALLESDIWLLYLHSSGATSIGADTQSLSRDGFLAVASGAEGSGRAAGTGEVDPSKRSQIQMATATPTAVRAHRKRTFDLDDDDLDLSQPPVRTEPPPQKAIRSGQDAQEAAKAQAPTRPLQSRPLNAVTDDTLSSFEASFAQRVHGQGATSQYAAAPRPQEVEVPDSPRHHLNQEAATRQQPHVFSSQRSNIYAPSTRVPLPFSSQLRPDNGDDFGRQSQGLPQPSHPDERFAEPQQPAHRQDYYDIEQSTSQRRRRIPGPAGGQDGATHVAVENRSQSDGVPRAPALPIRKSVQVVPPNDRDFQSAAWHRLLSDMDLPSFEPRGGTPELAATHSTIASVIKGPALKKIGRLLVIIKSITVTDHCAEAMIKDPTGEMRACIHANVRAQPAPIEAYRAQTLRTSEPHEVLLRKNLMAIAPVPWQVLEEEGEALARGAVLVLSRVSVFNSCDGQSQLAVITPNNIVRCYPPGHGPGDVPAAV